MNKSIYWHKSHNVTVLIYHLVFPAKYRRAVLSDEVEAAIVKISLELEKRYDVKFLEIGCDRDHVHFLVQSVPKMSITNLVKLLKSITARHVFATCPEVKKQLWGGEFWSDGFFASTVGRHADEKTMQNYVKNQGQPDYKATHKDYQLKLF